MSDEKPLGQRYHEEVTRLVGEGMSNADAIRSVAKSFGKTENAVRGGIHQYRARHNVGGSGRGTRRTRSRESVDDYLSNARSALKSALDLIDREVDAARKDLDAAQARYDKAVASVAGRKAEIQSKLNALS